MARHNDEALLRRAFEAARRSRANGDHPFGALLAGPDGCCASNATAIPPKAGT
jgi:tRNA(Arg) A34 adenosine deaminase TadA